MRNANYINGAVTNYPLKIPSSVQLVCFLNMIFVYIFLLAPFALRREFIKENKKVRKQELDQEPAPVATSRTYYLNLLWIDNRLMNKVPLYYLKKVTRNRMVIEFRKFAFILQVLLYSLSKIEW